MGNKSLLATLYNFNIVITYPGSSLDFGKCITGAADSQLQYRELHWITTDPTTVER